MNKVLSKGKFLNASLDCFGFPYVNYLISKTNLENIFVVLDMWFNC